MSLYTLRRVTADERRCWRFLKKLRWPGRVTCPRCRRRVGRPTHGRWSCWPCRYRFSVTSGTVLHGRRLLCSQLIWVVGLLEYGLAAAAIAATIGATEKTVRSLVYAVGRSLGAAQFAAKLRGTIELDDSYWGGRRKGKRGRGAAGKTPMVGLKTRRGRARILAVPHLRNPRLRKTIRAQAAQGSRFITDGLPAYGKLRREGFRHWRINHGQRFRVGRKHTQGVEGLWGHVKPKLFAAHRHLSPQHLQNYLNLQTWKFGRQKPHDFISVTLKTLLTTLSPTT